MASTMTDINFDSTTKIMSNEQIRHKSLLLIRAIGSFMDYYQEDLQRLPTRSPFHRCRTDAIMVHRSRDLCEALRAFQQAAREWLHENLPEGLNIEAFAKIQGFVLQELAFNCRDIRRMGFHWRVKELILLLMVVVPTFETQIGVGLLNNMVILRGRDGMDDDHVEELEKKLVEGRMQVRCLRGCVEMLRNIATYHGVGEDLQLAPGCEPWYGCFAFSTALSQEQVDSHASYGPGFEKDVGNSVPEPSMSLGENNEAALGQGMAELAIRTPKASGKSKATMCNNPATKTDESFCQCDQLYDQLVMPGEISNQSPQALRQNKVKRSKSSPPQINQAIDPTKSQEILEATSLLPQESTGRRTSPPEQPSTTPLTHTRDYYVETEPAEHPSAIYYPYEVYPALQQFRWGFPYSYLREMSLFGGSHTAFFDHQSPGQMPYPYLGVHFPVSNQFNQYTIGAHEQQLAFDAPFQGQYPRMEYPSNQRERYFAGNQYPQSRIAVEYTGSSYGCPKSLS